MFIYMRRDFLPFSFLFSHLPLNRKHAQYTPCQRRGREGWLIYVSTLQVCLLLMFVSETIFLQLSFSVSFFFFMPPFVVGTIIIYSTIKYI